MKRYLLLFFIFIILAMMIDSENQWYITLPLLTVIFFISRSSFRLFMKWKLILLLCFLAFGAPLILGIKDCSFLGIPYSSEYLMISTIMVNRSIIILLSIKMITQKIPVDQMSRGLQRIRLKQFSQVFSTALIVLPEVKLLTKTTFQEFKTRNKEGNFFSDVYYFSVKLIIKILRFADNYSPEKK